MATLSTGAGRAGQAGPLDALYREGMAHQAARRFEQAAECYRRILAQNPRSPEVHFQLARIFLDLGQVSRALPHAAAAAQGRPGEPAVWLLFAQVVALTAEEPTEAEFLKVLGASRLDPALKLQLQDRFRLKYRPSARLPAALAGDLKRIVEMMNAGRFAEAETRAGALFAKNPKALALLKLQGTAQAEQGRHEAAIVTFRKACQLDPGDAEAFSSLGQALANAGRAAEAIRAFSGAVAVAPNMVAALNRLAISLVRENDPHAALPYALKAARLEPGNVVGLVTLGNIYTRLRDYDAAEAPLRKAIRLDPERAEPHALLAQVLTRINRDEEALALYDRALALDPVLPLGLSGKATLLQTLGRFEEAEEWFRRAFAQNATSGELYRSFIVSHRTQAGDPVLDEMIRHFENEALPDSDRSSFAYGIAKGLEDVKAYDRVFPYLKAANDLARKVAPYDFAERERELAELAKIYEGMDWQGRRVEGTTDFAPIFVSGLPRSGTTLIEQIISSHSSVTGGGELNQSARLCASLFFDEAGDQRRLAEAPDTAFAALGKSYESIMRERFPGVVRLTDKSIQSYLYLGALKLSMPKARFIIVRRDPRDNLLSIYKNKFADGTHLYANSLSDLGRFYRSFHAQIEFWRALVPDWFHEVQYETLIKNPEEETRKLIAACGLPWEDACLNFHENKRKVDTLSVFQVRQPISRASLRSWQRYEDHLGEMFDALGDLLPRDAEEVTDAAR